MSEPTPEYYSDVYHMRSSPWGVAITFSVASPKEGVDGHDVCIVRLSHETGKTLAMMLRRQLRQYERDTSAVIAVPTEVMNQLSLAPEDW